MIKVIEFYVRDLFPRTVKKKGCTSGQVVELPRCPKDTVLDAPVQTPEYRNLEEECETPQYREESDNEMHRRKHTKPLVAMILV